MDSLNIPCRGVKRRRADSPLNLNHKILRKKVDISCDTWLQALKFLTCPQWMQKCFICRQINEVVRCNTSRLPMIVIDNAAMYYSGFRSKDNLKKLPLRKYTTVAFDTVMQGNESIQWFKNRRLTLEATEYIPAENALINAKGWKLGWKRIVNICIVGSGQKKSPLSRKEKHAPWHHSELLTQPYCIQDLMRDVKFGKPVLFYAQFNPALNQYSWDYLAQFLKFIYHPTSYIKQVKMNAVNQKFVDSLKCNSDSFSDEPRYIRCEAFSLKGISNTNTVNLSYSLMWMIQNVRAETIKIHRINCNMEHDLETFNLLANFLLDPSGARLCASKKMEINVSEAVTFLNVLIEDHATKKKHVHGINGKPLRIDSWGKRERYFSLFIGSLPENVTEETLRKEFSKYGKPIFWKVENDGQFNQSGPFGLVSYASEQEALNALKSGPHTIEGAVVDVRNARDASRT